VALDPHSEQPDLSLPEDYHSDHPDEHPTDWGWHGEWGRASRIAGWITAIILLLMIGATHYNFSGAAWLIGFAAAIVGGLIWDMQRRKNAWRK
jgi:fatty acid desaturase